MATYVTLFKTKTVRDPVERTLLEVINNASYVDDLLNRFTKILSTENEDKIQQLIKTLPSDERIFCEKVWEGLVAILNENLNAPAPSEHPTSYLKLQGYKDEIVAKITAAKITGKTYTDTKEIVLTNGKKITDYIPDEILERIFTRKNRNTAFS